MDHTEHAALRNCFTCSNRGALILEDGGTIWTHGTKCAHIPPEHCELGHYEPKTCPILCNQTTGQCWPDAGSSLENCPNYAPR